VIFDGSVHEFYLALLLRIVPNGFYPVIFFEKFFDCQFFCQLFSGSGIIRRMYSSLKVNIADGSIPPKQLPEKWDVK
jgi:hypothetical protein